MALTFKSVFSGAGKVLKKAAPVAGALIGNAVLPGSGALIGGALSSALGSPGRPKVDSYDAIPSDVKGLRTQTADYLGKNIGGLNQTAAQSGPTGYTRTADVQSPLVNGIDRAQSGTASSTDGRYVPLNNFNPNVSTNATTAQQAASAGNGQTGDIMSRLNGVNGQGNSAILNSLLSGGGGVGAQKVAGLTEGQQSVSDLATGGFMDKLLAQYSPYFEQQRQKALAGAKEASGNLTGSGFANALGNSTAQTLAQQQAQLGDLAQFGIGQEVSRQGNLAGLQNQRNLADASNSLQASIATAGNNLQGAASAGQYSNAAQEQMIQALEASGQIDLANLVREQGRLTGNAQMGNDVALQNRGISSNEAQAAGQLGLNRDTTLAGLMQNDAQAQAGRDQQTNLANSGAQNQRDELLAQLKQQLGLSNRQLSSQEEQFLSQLLQNNNQFNASQTNTVGNNNANRIASLLGGLTTAGVGVPNQTQSPGFLDSLFGGLTAAAPLIGALGKPGSSGGTVKDPFNIPKVNIPQVDISKMMSGGPGANVMAGGVSPSIMSGGPGGTQAPTSGGPVFTGAGFSGGLNGQPSPFAGGNSGSLQANPFTPAPTNIMSGGPAGGAPSSIAGSPQSIQGFLDALKNQGMFSQLGAQGGTMNRPASTFLNQLPQLRAAA